MSDSKATPAKPEIDKLDAIKEIIFGENIKAYEHEFKQLKDHINQLQAENKEVIEGVKAHFEKEITSLKTHLNEKIDTLKNEVSSLSDSAASRNQISALLNEMAEKLK